MFWKLGNPEGVKAICEFTLNWYLRAALDKSCGTLLVNPAMKTNISIHKLSSPGHTKDIALSSSCQCRKKIHSQQLMPF